jgi:hypothetical protein
VVDDLQNVVALVFPLQSLEFCRFSAYIGCMTEKLGFVKNPLGIIAIFAGLAEVSATGVLPFLTEKNQSIFIWFVMTFPFILVILFFLTLWIKHIVLYAPSDFRTDEAFLGARPAEKTTNAAGDIVKPLEEDVIILTKKV